MLTALEQKKFIDWFVEDIFEEPDEFFEVRSPATPELKKRLRFSCYRGLRQALMDFNEYDEKRMRMPVKYTKNGIITYANWPERQSEPTRRYGFFLYGCALEESVKTKLVNDELLKPHMNVPEKLSRLFSAEIYFENECEKIAHLFNKHYLAKIRDEEKPENEM